MTTTRIVLVAAALFTVSASAVLADDAGKVIDPTLETLWIATNDPSIGAAAGYTAKQVQQQHAMPREKVDLSN